jgi:hypothetical protein
MDTPVTAVTVVTLENPEVVILVLNHVATMGLRLFFTVLYI